MGRKNSKKKRHNEKDRKSTSRPITGVLEITRSGMGFATVEGSETDVLIRPNDFNTALHGDKVRLRIKPGGNGRRQQAIVEEVLHRRRTEFIGRLEMNKGYAFFIPDVDKPMPDFFIPQESINGAADGDRVVAKLVRWEQDGKRPQGEVLSIMDPENNNDAAMKEILLESGFPLQFDDEALEVAARIPDTISEDEIKKRLDVRPVLTITIDPVDAKDFDDAISIRLLKNGH